MSKESGGVGLGVGKRTRKKTNEERWKAMKPTTFNKNCI